MHLKTYQGVDENLVMRQARRDLGEKATLLSSFSQDGQLFMTFGWDNEDQSQPHAKDETVQNYTDSKILRDQEMFLAAIEGQGLSEDLLNVIAEIMVENLSIPQALSKILMQQSRLYPWEDFLRPASPLLLIGPPGSGKTVVMAKLAHQQCQKDRPILMATTDIVKTGGVEQVVAFARALSLPCLTLPRDGASIHNVLQSVVSTHTVLVDSTSMDPDSAEDIQYLQSLKQAIDFHICLVLSGETSPAYGHAMMKKFSALGANSFIVTRLDTAGNVASLLSLICQKTLPFLGYTHSPLVSHPLSSSEDFSHFVWNRCQKSFQS